MENKTTDLIAKLLANEDISIVHSKVSTASFQIDKRILTLPLWKDMSAELTGMLVGHEVGHALYTTTDYYDHEFKDEPAFHGYLNVLEDVRIEKFMKRRYPGLRKTFIAGYKELNDKDFFGVKQMDLADLLLIDRINLYFKAGYDCGVAFTKLEKQFVDRAERTETIADVIELAKEIYEASKEELEKKREETKSKSKDEKDGASEEEETEEQEGESESQGESDEEADEEAEDSQEQNESDNLESITDKNYQRKVEELADTSIAYKYWNIGEFNYNPLVPHAEITKVFTDRKAQYAYLATISPEKAEAIEKFKSSSTGVVNYLVKEFEMKKAASMYKRATVAKTGQLNTRKLYNYKLSDDIFKRITTVKEGKNHGMMFLLDWSGSMVSSLDQTIDQVINLAMFCRRAQIPFQVMAFSSSWSNEDYKAKNPKDSQYDNRKATPAGVLSVNLGRMSLLEFFNHKMTNSEFNNMVINLKSHPSTLGLGETPLNEALAYMDNYISKFKKMNNVEKLTFITLTDGEGSALEGAERLQNAEYATVNGKQQMVKIKNFIADPITKKNYQISANAASTQTNALLSMIKEHHNVTVLGFYLTETSYNSLKSAINSHYEKEYGYAVMIDRMKKEIREKGYASLKGTGRDDLFILPLASTKIVDKTLDDIDSSITAAAIARKFGKALNTKKTSRVLLSNFINYIA